MGLKVEVISIFPELFEPFIAKGLLGQACSKEIIQFRSNNPRDFTTDNHRSVDDRPYGGGDGMVMMAEPLEKTVQSIWNRVGKLPLIYLSPQGEVFNDRIARSLAETDGFILLCGRYGGVDERFVSEFVDREISVGDFVLHGGEAAAICITEAVSRFVPSVLGNNESSKNDSFSNGLLEAPQMTRPPEYKGLKVPSVLLSGDHRAIEKWRVLVGLLKTYFKRPDLVKAAGIPDTHLNEALKLYSEMSENDRKACNLSQS